jgi:hypothetical protein
MVSTANDGFAALGCDCSRQGLCVLPETSLAVRVNIVQARNGQSRFTAERVARTRPKTYRAIALLLAEPDVKIEHIAERHRVSTHTVRAIREREAVAIAERKQRLMSVFANVAELSAERMEELAGQASLRDAGITAGIATDKLLALTGDPTSSFQQTHIHLQSIDIAGTFNSLLHSLQAKARALPPSPAPALTDQSTDTSATLESLPQA